MSKLILLVDDDVTILATLFAVLEEAGHRVILAAGGREAAKAVASSRFDVVVTDVFMPELDGLELIRLARMADARVRIVAMSGFDRHSGFHTLAIAEQLGADATLQKPVVVDQLLGAVNGLPCANAALRPIEGEMSNAAEF